MTARARDLGIPVGSLPSGIHNAITDVAGVRVGHTTLITGDGPLDVGAGPVRTGVTVIIPRDEPWSHPLFAAPFRLNGNGELTGLEWVRESGTLTSYIGLTNTHSVGVVRDALVADEARRRNGDRGFFSLPVVGETWDGVLNDINGFHVRPEHVHAAIAAATTGPVAEGSVGSGTGMMAHGFKGGIGTASRVVPEESGGYTVGVLVQANHGARSRLTIGGVRVGELFDRDLPPVERFLDRIGEEEGSIIVVVATDAPLLPTQCARLAKRAALGIGRTGGAGENGSGDLVLCFSATNDTLAGGFERGAALTSTIEVLANEHIDPLFYATIEATEEAILNAMLASPTFVGVDGFTAPGLPHDLLLSYFA
ncbi:DmpA family aminopeptidase [Leifsonia poae]|uniref:DmpA family aminopeptidase n=1 Tax=Leifsonia poae TaxID=110933 RepID=UPI001CBC7461|nr:P1 family peptidase [Leifsonia poae]